MMPIAEEVTVKLQATSRVAARKVLKDFDVTLDDESIDRLVLSVIGAWSPGGPSPYVVSSHDILCQVAQAPRVIVGPGLIAPVCANPPDACVVHVDAINRVYRAGADHGLKASSLVEDPEMRHRVSQAIDQIGASNLIQSEKIDRVIDAVRGKIGGTSAESVLDGREIREALGAPKPAENAEWTWNASVAAVASVKAERDVARTHVRELTDQRDRCDRRILELEEYVRVVDRRAANEAVKAKVQLDAAVQTRDRHGTRIGELERDLARVSRESLTARTELSELRRERDEARRDRQMYKEQSFPLRVMHPAGMGATALVTEERKRLVGEHLRAYLVNDLQDAPTLRGDDPADRLLARVVSFGRAAHRAMAGHPSDDRIAELGSEFTALEAEVCAPSDQVRAEVEARDHVGGLLGLGSKPLWSSVRNHVNPTGDTSHVLMLRKTIERYAASQSLAQSLITAYDAWHDLEHAGKPDEGQQLATKLAEVERGLRDVLGMNRAAPVGMMSARIDTIGQALDRLRACKILAERALGDERSDCKRWYNLTAKQAMEINELRADLDEVELTPRPSPGAPRISKLVDDAVRSVLSERGLPLDDVKLDSFADAVGQRAHAWICDYKLHNPREAAPADRPGPTSTPGAGVKASS